MSGSATVGSQNGFGIPVFLLKTRSTPNDGYDDYFSAAAGSNKKWQFTPTFVPVMEHRFNEEHLSHFKDLLSNGQISRDADAKYGGLIFTSQRAVEAFARLLTVEDGQNSAQQQMLKYLRHVPIYTVGPATSRALRTISHDPPLNVFGSETGNGEALAHYMLDHYAGWYPQRTLKPPLLFLVGEQRRDIIPKTLMNPDLPQIERIGVDELVVYETGVMENFGIEFESYLDQTKDAEIRWVVVFSPMGCEVMLRTLRLLDESTGKVRTGDRGGGCGARRGRRQTYIATIGPTTRDYLRKTFGFEPDVCAEKPSPEGIGEAIGGYMARIRAEHEAER